MTAETYVNPISRLRLVSVAVAAAIVLSVLLGAASTVNAQNTDAWKLTTGSMTVGADRRHATVTKLLDGRVLIAGGNTTAAGLAPYDTAYLYDPATETFTQTAGNMTTPRSLHTATLLPGGKVLIVGGVSTAGGGGNLASAELFDPAGGGTFTATDSMDLARSQHAATALQDGRVLISGGFDGTINDATNTAEIYSPVTGLFTPTGNLAAKRNTHTATLLNNGKVLLAGGVGAAPRITSAELFDPATGTFTAVSDMARARASHSATLLGDGTVLVAGGEPSVDYSHETFNPGTNAFGLLSAPGVPNVNWATGTAVGPSSGLIAGGNNDSTVAWFSAAAATTDSRLVTSATAPAAIPMNAPGQWGGGAVTLNNGRILVAGGGTAQGHLFCPSEKDFALLPIPDQTVAEGQALPALTVKGNLCDNQSLFAVDVSAEDLPAGAGFTPGAAGTVSGTLTWTPNGAQAGTYFVRFLAMSCIEGCFVLDSKVVKITVTNNTDPAIADADGDGVADADDNCPDVPNPNQANSDAPADNLGDACDPTPMPAAYNNKVTTATTVQPPATSNGYTTNPSEPILITGTVTFQPVTGTPYFFVNPTAFNLIPRVKLKNTTAFINADRIPEGLFLTFGGTTSSLGEVTTTAQTRSATVNLRDWYTDPASLPAGQYDVVLEYVNESLDPALVNGACTEPDACFEPVWVGIAPAAAATITVKNIAAGTSLLDQLIADVRALMPSIDPKLGNSLLSKLLDARNFLDKGNPNGTCNKLKDFIAQVNAQTGKGLTAEQAAPLIASATQIQQLLQCK